MVTFEKKESFRGMNVSQQLVLQMTGSPQAAHSVVEHENTQFNSDKCIPYTTPTS
jgi:hypothetical protein